MKKLFVVLLMGLSTLVLALPNEKAQGTFTVLGEGEYISAVGDAVVQYNVENYLNRGSILPLFTSIQYTGEQELYATFYKGGELFNSQASLSLLQDNVGWLGVYIVNHDVQLQPIKMDDAGDFGTIAMLDEKPDLLYAKVEGDFGTSQSNLPRSNSYMQLLQQDDQYFIGLVDKRFSTATVAGIPNEFDVVFALTTVPKGQPLPGVLASLVLGGGFLLYKRKRRA